ncbi:hypothetical protein D3C81_1364050 [compost metagenome]
MLICAVLPSSLTIISMAASPAPSGAIVTVLPLVVKVALVEVPLLITLSLVNSRTLPIAACHFPTAGWPPKLNTLFSLSSMPAPCTADALPIAPVMAAWLMCASSMTCHCLSTSAIGSRTCRSPSGKRCRINARSGDLANHAASSVSVRVALAIATCCAPRSRT